MTTKPLTLRDHVIAILQIHLEMYNYDVIRTAKVLNVGKSTIYRMIQNKELRTPKSK